MPGATIEPKRTGKSGKVGFASPPDDELKAEVCLLRGMGLEPCCNSDHVTPHRGDPELFWHGPLQSVCATCHSLFKQSEEKGGTKHLRGCGPDGEPLFYEW